MRDVSYIFSLWVINVYNMKKSKFIIFSLFYLLLFIGCSKDVIQENPSSNYPEEGNWTRYNFEGRFQSGRSNILFDSKGFLWFSTNLGACKFDGETWNMYSTKDGLATNDVTAINEDVNGTIWFGTDNFWSNSPGGFSSFDGENWNTINSNNGDNLVLVIFRDRSNKLWFGTNNGIREYDGSTWINDFPEIAGNRISSITEDSEGNMYFSNEDKIFCLFPDGDWRIIDHLVDVFGDEHISLILADGNSIWIDIQTSAGSNLKKYSLSDFTSSGSYNLFLEDGPPKSRISSMMIDDKKNLWCGTVKTYLPEELINNPDYQKCKNTIWKFDGSEWSSYNVNHQSIRGITSDKEGNIWFVAENELIRFALE